ncbi:NAD(P)H-dependent oxidoreductase [Actinopolymorpha sp. B17G11]|uniref:NADPH-dependent FMN reductase n=1 Tax=unclassified Actinopolymorpha TaxID=2627063 RepID=UPI0032D8D477
MPEPSFNLVVMVGSTREGRIGHHLARWFVSQVEPRDDMVTDLIDLADVEFPSVYPQSLGEVEKAFIARIAAADAYVVVTPEYNHGYPASLKQAIDFPYLEWSGKPVAFVSYGGMSGGLRAVEQLRQVFAEVNAATVRDSVSFHNVEELLDPSGELRDLAGCNAAAKAMLDQIVWWALALRAGRAARPFPA